jgi:hypothetical protein
MLTPPAMARPCGQVAEIVRTTSALASQANTGLMIETWGNRLNGIVGTPCAGAVVGEPARRRVAVASVAGNLMAMV